MGRPIAAKGEKWQAGPGPQRLTLVLSSTPMLVIVSMKNGITFVLDNL